MQNQKKINRRQFLAGTGAALAFVPMLRTSVSAGVQNLFAPVNLALNPGFEELAPPTGVGALNWMDYRAGYQRVIGGRDNSSWAAQIITSAQNPAGGPAQRIDLNQKTPNALTVTCWIRAEGVADVPDSDPFGHLGASAYVEAHLTDGSVMFARQDSKGTPEPVGSFGDRRFYPGDAQRLFRMNSAAMAELAYPGSAAYYGSFKWTQVGFNFVPPAPVEYMFVVPSLNKSIGTAYIDDVVVTESVGVSGKGYVAIVIDDGYEDAYQGFLEMKSRGLRGSIAVITDNIDEPGSLTTEQLYEMKTAGWAHACHSATHRDLTLLSEVELREELIESRSVFFDVLDEYPRSLILPFGAQNGLVLRVAGELGFTSVRPFETGLMPTSGAYPNDVKVQKVIGTTTPAEVKAMLATVQARGLAAVLVFHRVGVRAEDEYFTELQNFRAMLDAVLQSGVQVLNYDELIDQITGRRAIPVQQRTGRGTGGRIIQR